MQKPRKEVLLPSSRDSKEAKGGFSRGKHGDLRSGGLWGAWRLGRRAKQGLLVTVKTLAYCLTEMSLQAFA